VVTLVGVDWAEDGGAAILVAVAEALEEEVQVAVVAEVLETCTCRGVNVGSV
jgi:hypothetical protein